jgi:hypothetical protein
LTPLSFTLEDFTADLMGFCLSSSFSSISLAKSSDFLRDLFLLSATKSFSSSLLFLLLLLRSLLFSTSSFSSLTVSGSEASCPLLLVDLLPVLTMADFSSLGSLLSVLALFSLWGSFDFFDSVVIFFGAITGRSSLSSRLLYSLTLEEMLL